MKLKLSHDARIIYKQILKEVLSRIQLEDSKKYLDNFYPAVDRDEIIKRQKYFEENFKKVDGLKNYLSKIRKIEFKLKYFPDRTLFVDKENYEKALKMGVCKVEKSYDNYLVIGRNRFDLDKVEPHLIVPECYVLTLLENKEILESLSVISERIKGESIAPKILNELKKIEEVFSKKRKVEELDEIVLRKKEELNKRIEEIVKEYTLTLSGQEFLELISGLKSGYKMPEKFRKIEGLILDEISKCEAELYDVFGYPIEIFSKETIYPVEIDLKKLELIKKQIEEDISIEMYKKSREIIEKIYPFIEELKRELDLAFEIEFIRAVKEMCNNFSFPALVNNGLAFINGRHLFIKDPQPISYVVGEVREVNFEGTKGERVVILTGANSGGKTSLLELIAQIQILGQMGFPVNAEKAWITPVEELFFFKRKRSIYGAGAFESLLKSFAKAIAGNGTKLILIDEFEAVTEPGAAVKLIAEFLKIMHEKNYLVVIVTHLGGELMKLVDFARVDGIEASGLDEKFNLIVDRQPKFGILGRSTPELIVERLYRKSRGKNKEIFERLLLAFKKEGCKVENAKM